MLRRSLVATGPTVARTLPFASTALTNEKRTILRTMASNTTSQVFRPWKVEVVEASGDYREESWLESHTGGPLYAKQASLPRLPVPSIQDTLQRFLPTALPLAKTDGEAANLQAAIDSFPEQAAELQKLLLERDQTWRTNSSWLQHWWNTAGYLQVRDPVVMNVSYYFHFSPDAAAVTAPQRAAALLVAAATFRKEVCSGSMEAEHVGRGDRRKPLCSAAYKYMFHATRIPKKSHDSVKLYDPALNQHVIIALGGRFYALNLVDPVTEEPHHVTVLQKSLEELLLNQPQSPPPVELGWCTSMERDEWAAARSDLLQETSIAQAVTILESGALMVCLDTDVHAVSREAMANLILTGVGSNRWFDKSVQLIVSANGQAGLLGEHSMMDGMPVVQLADRLTKMTYNDCLSLPGTNTTTVPCEPIFTDDSLERVAGIMEPHVSKARADFATMVAGHDLDIQSFQGYGSSFMKKAGFSPDAFVQVAMQLATFRLWGEQGGTYEATQVRPFLHGRTETTRAVSMESAAVCEAFGLTPAMDEHDADIRSEKLKLLRDAAAAHIKYIGQAAQAQGVDRHFFGLSMLAGDAAPLPDLYKDPVFNRSKRWRVSTSHLTHPKFDGWGYGPVFPDGVGLAYSIHPRHCVFTITSRKSNEWTRPLSALLEQTMLELRTVIEMEQAANTPPQSKL